MAKFITGTKTKGRAKAAKKTRPAVRTSARKSSDASGPTAVAKARAASDLVHNIIVYSDDGKYYLITRDDWGQPIPVNDPSVARLDPLTDGGAYLAYLTPETAPGGGIGTVCTLVNLKSVLKNNTTPKRARKTGSARRLRGRS